MPLALAPNSGCSMLDACCLLLKGSCLMMAHDSWPVAHSLWSKRGRGLGPRSLFLAIIHGPEKGRCCSCRCGFGRARTRAVTRPPHLQPDQPRQPTPTQPVEPCASHPMQTSQPTQGSPVLVSLEDSHKNPPTSIGSDSQI